MHRRHKTNEPDLVPRDCYQAKRHATIRQTATRTCPPYQSDEEFLSKTLACEMTSTLSCERRHSICCEQRRSTACLDCVRDRLMDQFPDRNFPPVAGRAR